MFTFESWPINSTFASICQTEVKLHQIGPLVLVLFNTVKEVRVTESKVKVAAEVYWIDLRLLECYSPFCYDLSLGKCYGLIAESGAKVAAPILYVFTG